MGNCCIGQDYTKAEEFIINLFKDPSFNLKDFDYNCLLNVIVSKRVEQSICKKHIKEYLIPEFYCSNSLEKSNTFESNTRDLITNSNIFKYYDKIFDTLISILEEKNNMYLIILYFYPFISHIDENIEGTLYLIFKFTTSQMKINEIKSILYSYIKFCTIDITKSIYDVCTDVKLKENLNILLENVYNNDNLKMYIEEIVDEFKRNDVDKKQIITKQMIKNVIKKFDLSSLEKIRNHLLNEI